jgi:hypothetical protein
MWDQGLRLPQARHSQTLFINRSEKPDFLYEKKKSAGISRAIFDT